MGAKLYEKVIFAVLFAEHCIYLNLFHDVCTLIERHTLSKKMCILSWVDDTIVFKIQSKGSQFGIFSLLYSLVHINSHNIGVNFPTNYIISLRNCRWAFAHNLSNGEARKILNSIFIQNKILFRWTSTMKTRTYRSYFRREGAESWWRILSNTLLIWNSLMYRWGLTFLAVSF